MRVWPAVLVGQPLRQHDIKSRLGGIAGQDGLLRSTGCSNPLDILRQLNVDRFGIKIGRSDRPKCDE
jgi:hypothetical protein